MTSVEESPSEPGARPMPAERLERLARRLLEVTGTGPETTAPSASSLVEANPAGHGSYGMLRLPSYLNPVRKGRIRPDTTPVLLRRQKAIAIVNARDGRGQREMWLATEQAIALACPANRGSGRERRAAEGVPVASSAWSDLLAGAGRWGIEP